MTVLEIYLSDRLGIAARSATLVMTLVHEIEGATPVATSTAIVIQIQFSFFDRIKRGNIVVGLNLSLFGNLLPTNPCQENLIIAFLAPSRRLSRIVPHLKYVTHVL